MKNLFSIGSLIMLIPILFIWWNYFGFGSFLGIVIFVIILITFSAIFLFPKKQKDIEILDKDQVTPTTQTITKEILYTWPLYTFTRILFIGLVLALLAFLYALLFSGTESGDLVGIILLMFFPIFFPIILLGVSLLSFLIAGLSLYINTNIPMRIWMIIRKYLIIIVGIIAIGIIILGLLIWYYEAEEEQTKQYIEQQRQQWIQEIERDETKR